MYTIASIAVWLKVQKEEPPCGSCRYCIKAEEKLLQFLKEQHKKNKNKKQLLKNTKKADNNNEKI